MAEKRKRDEVEAEREVTVAAHEYLALKCEQNKGVVYDALSTALRPIPEISISDWCEQNLVLPAEMTAEPGPYRVGRTPYIKEILDCLHPLSPYREVVWCASAQVSKTQVQVNFISFCIANAPANMLLGMANKEQKDNFVQSRLNPFIDANPVLKSRIFSKRKNEKGDTVRKKSFPGGTLYFASGEAAADWRSNPCRYGCADEIDAMPKNVRGEGSPVDLMRRRTATFSGREKIFLTSTPTNDNSAIVEEYKNTDMRKYYWECPHCHKLHLPDFSMLQWEAEGTIVHRVWYECPECGAKIFNEDKQYMNEHGIWIPTNTNPTDTKKAGFWINAIYSPWMPWEKIVATYLEAQKTNSEPKLISFYNTLLGKPYETSTDVPKWERLLEKARGSHYLAGEIPNEVLFLTSFTDVQQDRLETEIIGWGKNARNYSIDHLILLCPKDTTTADPNNKVYQDWEQLIYRNTWFRKDGVRVQLLASGIDRSYNTNAVSEIVSRIDDTKHLIAVRGNDRLTSVISSIKKDTPGRTHTEVSKSQHKNRTEGVYYYIESGVSKLKAEVYRALKLDDNPEQDKAFYNSFPENYDEEYFRQLTAEHYIAADNRHPNGYWYKDRARNEMLDTHVGNLAMFYYSGASRFTEQEWEQIATQMAQSRVKTIKPVPQKVQTQRRILNPGIDI